MPKYINVLKTRSEDLPVVYTTFATDNYDTALLSLQMEIERPWLEYCYTIQQKKLGDFARLNLLEAAQKYQPILASAAV